MIALTRFPDHSSTMIGFILSCCSSLTFSHPVGGFAVEMYLGWRCGSFAAVQFKPFFSRNLPQICDFEIIQIRECKAGVAANALSGRCTTVTSPPAIHSIPPKPCHCQTHAPFVLTRVCHWVVRNVVAIEDDDREFCKQHELDMGTPIASNGPPELGIRGGTSPFGKMKSLPGS